MEVKLVRLTPRNGSPQLREAGFEGQIVELEAEGRNVKMTILFGRRTPGPTAIQLQAAEELRELTLGDRQPISAASLMEIIGALAYNEPLPGEEENDAT